MTAEISWDELPLREEIRDAVPYGDPHFDVPARLNMNENPYPPSDLVRADILQAVRVATDNIHRYPDREATQLRQAMAEYLGFGLTADNIWAANGSNELMIQILGAFGGPGRTVLNFTPSFSMYPEYARDTHTEYVAVPRLDDFSISVELAASAIAEHKPHVTIIASPNNPTGTLTDFDVIEKILTMTDGIVVVDAAYQEFSSGQSALELLPRYGNLVVTRTMSKAFAFAGARVGYAAAAEAVINALRVVRLPYHLNSYTQAVACAAFSHADELLSQVSHLCVLRDEAITRVRAMGLDAPDSQANFFLFGPWKNRHDTWRALVDHGVLVRETGPVEYLRASIGTDEQMELFYRGLTQVLAQERSQG
ncbi:MAG: histidinol-phosphate transaminase [Propionibacteriaceae bacterium]|nr:histidinol-phosphate transaminase [Propionibacteriaceae bacterium]